MKAILLILCAAAFAGCTPQDSKKIPAPAPEPSPPAAAPAREEPSSPQPSPQPRQDASIRKLENAETSETAVARGVLKAIREKDARALQQMRVTQEEFRKYVYPESETAGPRSTITWELQWALLDHKSREGLKNLLRELGGAELELLEVLPRGIEQHETHHFLTRPALRVREKNGRESLIKVLGSILVLDGQYKLLSYPED